MSNTTLSALHVFCRVLELASFRQAADSLHMPVATVSSQIRSLELRLGVKLLVRSSRHVAPTDEGLAYYRRVMPLLEGLDEAEQVLKDTQGRPAGRLHVSVSASVVRWVIAPMLPEFAARFPDISLRLVATDRVLDLAAEGLDCAIRAGTPLGDGMVVKPLPRLAQFFAASPLLVARYGMPDSPQAMAQLPFITYAGPRDSSRVQGLAFKGSASALQRVAFTAASSLSVDDGSAYVALAVAGLGVIESPAYDLNPELNAQRLVLLVPDWRGPDIAFHAVYAKGRANLPRVTAFVDWVGGLLTRPEFARAVGSI